MDLELEELINKVNKTNKQVSAMTNYIEQLEELRKAQTKKDVSKKCSSESFPALKKSKTKLEDIYKSTKHKPTTKTTGKMQSKTSLANRKSTTTIVPSSKPSFSNTSTTVESKCYYDSKVADAIENHQNLTRNIDNLLKKDRGAERFLTKLNIQNEAFTTNDPALTELQSSLNDLSLRQNKL